MVRRVLVEDDASRVAWDMRESRETVYKWVCRYRQEGMSGLPDRSSRPRYFSGFACCARRGRWRVTSGGWSGSQKRLLPWRAQWGAAP